MVVYQQLRQDHRRRIEEADAAGFGDAVFIFRLIAYFEKLYLDNMVAADNGRRVEPHWPARPAHAEAAAGMGNALLFRADLIHERASWRPTPICSDYALARSRSVMSS